MSTHPDSTELKTGCNISVSQPHNQANTGIHQTCLPSPILLLTKCTPRTPNLYSTKAEHIPCLEPWLIPALHHDLLRMSRVEGNDRG